MHFCLRNSCSIVGLVLVVLKLGSKSSIREIQRMNVVTIPLAQTTYFQTKFFSIDIARLRRELSQDLNKR